MIFFFLNPNTDMKYKKLSYKDINITPLTYGLSAKNQHFSVFYVEKKSLL